MDKLNHIIGCLMGGACGDALGYSVEFDKIKKIKKIYGAQGITDFELTNGRALVSDDTQMTLFTAAGILMAKEKKVEYSTGIWNAYKDWYYTQTKNNKYHPFTELYNIDSLHNRRAPGNTCISVLKIFPNKRTIEKPANLSKGCGGIMRVAPVGCIELGSTNYANGWLGAETAALTHGHPLGYIPAGFLADLVHRIIICEEDKTIDHLIMDSLNETVTAFENCRSVKYFESIIKKAIELSKTKQDDLSGIARLGEGWVAEETAAIAIYSCLRYPDDLKKAIICAVNHNGDSDSTGSVTGNILGAYLGDGAVESAFDVKLLDQYGTILQIADQLAHL